MASRVGIIETLAKAIHENAGVGVLEVNLGVRPVAFVNGDECRVGCLAR